MREGRGHYPLIPLTNQNRQQQQQEADNEEDQQKGGRREDCSANSFQSTRYRVKREREDHKCEGENDQQVPVACTSLSFFLSFHTQGEALKQREERMRGGGGIHIHT